jgi:hypothetical protein
LQGGTTLPHVRARARERTLAMLRLFLEPPNNAMATSGADKASTPSSKDPVPVFRTKTNTDAFTPLTQSSRRGSASYAQPVVKSTDRRTARFFSKSLKTWTRRIVLSLFALAALMWLLAPRWNQWIQTRGASHQRHTPITQAGPVRGGGGGSRPVVQSRDMASALSFLDQNRHTLVSLKSRVGARDQLVLGEPVKQRAISAASHAGGTPTHKTQPPACHETHSCSARFGPLLGIWSNFVKHG